MTGTLAISTCGRRVLDRARSVNFTSVENFFAFLASRSEALWAAVENAARAFISRVF
jgi:hypothetical protein